MRDDLIAHLAGLTTGSETQFERGMYTLAAFTLYPDEDSLKEAIGLVKDDVADYIEDMANCRIYGKDEG